MPGWGDVLHRMNVPKPPAARFDGLRRTGPGSMGGGPRGGNGRNMGNGGGAGGGGNGGRGGGNGAGGGRAPGYSVTSTTTPAPTGQQALGNTGYGVSDNQWASMAPLAGVTQQQYNQSDDFAALNNAQQQQLGGLGSGMVLDVNAGNGIPLTVAPGAYLQDSASGLSNWAAVAGALENWKPVTVTQEYGTMPNRQDPMRVPRRDRPRR